MLYTIQPDTNTPYESVLSKQSQSEVHVPLKVHREFYYLAYSCALAQISNMSFGLKGIAGFTQSDGCLCVCMCCECVWVVNQENFYLSLLAVLLITCQHCPACLHVRPL